MKRICSTIQAVNVRCRLAVSSVLLQMLRKLYVRHPCCRSTATPYIGRRTTALQRAVRITLFLVTPVNLDSLASRDIWVVCVILPNSEGTGTVVDVIDGLRRTQGRRAYRNESCSFIGGAVAGETSVDADKSIAVRIFLINGYRSVLWGLERLIESRQPAMRAVGSATSCAEALEQIDEVGAHDLRHFVVAEAAVEETRGDIGKLPVARHDRLVVSVHVRSYGDVIHAHQIDQAKNLVDKSCKPGDREARRPGPDQSARVRDELRVVFRQQSRV